MKRIVSFGVFLILLVSTVLPMTAASAASLNRTYTVLVGANDVGRGISLMSYFPATLRIHVGDTVIWKANSHEIHTVTFLAGSAAPGMIEPAPASFPAGTMMLNPQVAFPTAPSDGMFDGSTFANSGLMSTDPGGITKYSLTFTKEGTYSYVCLVHGVMMSGTIQVVGDSVSLPSPARVLRFAYRDINKQLGNANGLFRAARAQVPAPVKNSNGTTTYTVVLGYMSGNVMLMDFFPRRLVVHPGDTVKYILPKDGEAPHTITFLNGAPDISFVIPTPNPNPPPPALLLINPMILGPINPGQPLTRSGIFSSGLLDPSTPGPKSYEITIGNIFGKIWYQCLLHDTSGMVGLLNVVPK